MGTASIRTAQKLPVFRSTIPKHRALLLDYDGTLAPFVTDRDRAYPYLGVSELLDDIAANCDTRVVIVTGRDAHEIPFLLKTEQPLEVWGCHGLERVHPSGTYWRATLDGRTEQVLLSVADRLRFEGFAGLVETKPGCVGVHWRGLTPKYSEQVKSAAYNCFSRYVGFGGLRIQEFDHGVELRVRNCSKARVIDTILSELHKDAAVAFLGDDNTDEEAFRALHGKGITILVRSAYRFTSAQYWLRPPDELIWFLRDWVQACKGVE